MLGAAMEDHDAAAALEPIIQTALAKDADDRYATALDIAYEHELWRGRSAQLLGQYEKACRSDSP